MNADEEAIVLILYDDRYNESFVNLAVSKYIEYDALPKKLSYYRYANKRPVFQNDIIYFKFDPLSNNFNKNKFMASSEKLNEFILSSRKKKHPFNMSCTVKFYIEGILIDLSWLTKKDCINDFEPTIENFKKLFNSWKVEE